MIDLLREVLRTALRVCDGWIGQHEMGELWRDEVADMEALQAALANALATNSPEIPDSSGQAAYAKPDGEGKP